MILQQPVNFCRCVALVAMLHLPLPRGLRLCWPAADVGCYLKREASAACPDMEGPLLVARFPIPRPPGAIREGRAGGDVWLQARHFQPEIFWCELSGQPTNVCCCSAAAYEMPKISFRYDI